MGSYRFERDTDQGAGENAGDSLEDDVARALGEIDWVERFAIHANEANDLQVVADVIFDEDWPDHCAANPGHVAQVFRRYGLRTIGDSANSKIVANDPLSADPATGDDAEGLDLFLMED
ncbi:hypothetical protein [Arenimonas oryziterrae]|uniref:Uncharacterized protein n=1 Tax=Arenimonas oryziterrae DSM 21050 = YC6267 TaxID=1121015 RepID=A0A091AWJ6_9GAMM|nr:hypothetical protein [Arenimonas oryziterrae]KFN43657.1 hypothetical protein N789_10295 [Arenimonas oryziterrae DSM 21050 = YC6267]